MPDEQAPQEAPPKKKGPLLTIVVVALLMVFEGVGIVVFLALTSAPPATVSADDIENPEKDANATVEVEFVKDKFTNSQSQQIWKWDLEVHLKVKNKHKEYVEKTKERQAAELHSEIARIMRSAQISQLQEPDFRTLTRQLNKLCEETFGIDDTEGEPRVSRVIISKCEGLPINP